MAMMIETSVGSAVGSLRARIDGDSRLKTRAKVALGMLGSAVVILYFNAVALSVFYGVFGSTALLAAALVLGNALLVRSAKKRHEKAAKPRPKKGEIYIGRSYAHSTEIYGNVRERTIGGSAAGGRSSLKAVEVGTDGDHYIDYLNEPNPHVLMLGSTSSGKTTTMRTFVSRAALQDKVNFLAIDWNGESEEWARMTNATFWKVPENLKVNPFLLNGLSKEARASVATENFVVAAHLTPLQSTKLKSSLLGFYLNGKEPSLFELWQVLCAREKNDLIGHRMRAIQRVIGTEPDGFWERVMSGNNIISLAGLNESEKSLVAYALLQRLTEVFEKSPDMNGRLRLMVVLDEAWQFLTGERREFGIETHQESIVEKIIRLGRKYGFGMVISTQQVEDLPNVFINSSALVMLHYYRNVGLYNKKKFDLTPFELAYVRSAAQGEMLLFDRAMNHRGKWHSEYIKVAPLTEKEAAQLANLQKLFVPPKIDEPEMPIEEYHNGRPVTNRVTVKAYRAAFPIPVGAPTPAMHAAMLGIQNSRSKTMSQIIGYIRSRGWLTSYSTLYGSNGSKPGILDTLIKAGFAQKDGEHYSLTEKGLGWVDPMRILMNQSERLGSEEHRLLLVRTTELLHENNTLVLTTREKHSFDLLSYPVHEKKKWIWDQKGIKGYEAQTSARKDSVDENKGKAERWKIPLVWIANDSSILEAIKGLTNNTNEYMLITDNMVRP